MRLTGWKTLDSRSNLTVNLSEDEDLDEYNHEDETGHLLA